MKKYILIIVALCLVAWTSIAMAATAVPLDLYPSTFDLITGWMEIRLFLLGVVLLGIEVFIPGFGIFGIGGICCILGSFYLALGGNRPALYWLTGGLIVVIVALAVLIKYLPNNPAWNLVVLKTRQENKHGYSSTPDLSNYIGKKGTTVSMLRPSGTALIEGKRVDVVADGEFVATGESIIVFKVVGNKIIVKREK
jgi:membrane-bound serine protease (ClpP class)